MATLFDSYVSYEGGMNSGLQPVVLPENQYAGGVNIICRRGEIQPRPSFKAIPLYFESLLDKKIFQQGKFQGAWAYTPAGKYLSVAVIAGTVFLINLDTGNVLNLSADSAYLSSMVDRCYFVQAEKYGIVQDGSSAPIIIDTSTAFVSNPLKNQVPAGTIMAYGHGRLFVTTGTNIFLAGDIYLPYEPSTLLYFTETTYLSGGGAFALSEELGKITGMAFSPTFDTSTGDGPLLVSGETGFVSYQIQKPRSEWLDTDLAKIQLRGVGASGAAAFAELNQDLFFWSSNGLRSFAMTQTEASQIYRYTNLSHEVLYYTDMNTPWLESLISMGAFNDRLLLTVRAEKVTAQTRNFEPIDDYVFRGLVALDFAQINGGAFSGKYSKTAAYDGVWTGFGFTQLVAVPSFRERPLWVFCKNRENNNMLMYVGCESTGTEFDNVIQCKFYSRGFNFRDEANTGDALFIPKKYQQLLLWVDAVQGKVPIELALRCDSYPTYTSVAKLELTALTEVTGVPEENYQVGVPNAFPALMFPLSEAEKFDASTCKSLIAGYLMEYSLTWSGYVRFSKALLTAKPVEVKTLPACLSVVAEALLVQNELRNDFTYTVIGATNE